MITKVGQEQLYAFTKYAQSLSPEDLIALQQLAMQSQGQTEVPALLPPSQPNAAQMGILGSLMGAGAGGFLEHLRPGTLFSSKNYLPAMLAGSLLGGGALASQYI